MFVSPPPPQADVNAVAEPDMYTPLMFAAMCGANEVIRLLLWNGARRSVKNKRGKTAAEIASFVGHYECAASISQYLPTEVFDAFIELEAGPLQASPSLANALFLYANQSDLRPAQLWEFLDDSTVLAPNKGRSWASDTAVEILDVVGRMCINLWKNKQLGLKLTYLRTILQWFVLATTSSEATTEEEDDEWLLSLRMADLIVGQVCATSELSLVTGARAAVAGGPTKLSPYLSLRALVDGPKMAMKLRDQQLCAVCYETGASRPTTNDTGSEVCCSDECVELHAQCPVSQV
jgi:hypothetical protein